MKLIYKLLIGSLFLLAGCLFPAQPDITVSFYTLDYQPPLNHALTPLDTSIKIARFTSTQEMNTQSMIFSPKPGMQAAYNYSRWRVYPADLCADYLIRDMRYSGLMQVAGGGGTTRFRLEGALEEFLRVDRPQGSKVRLVLNCSLMDQKTLRETEAMPLFQRTYVQEVTVEDDLPLTMALALSKAMAAFSQQAQYDIYLAVQSRLRDEATVSGGAHND